MKYRKFAVVYVLLTSIGLLFEILGVSVIKYITPLYLLLTTAALVYISGLRKRSAMILLFVNGLVGYAIEVVGVKTGLVFGDYQYGGTLGPAFLGVPLMLVVLWALIPWLSLSIASRLHKYPVALSGLIAVSYDIVLEHFAVRYDLWQWKNGIPLSNFIAWFVITCILAYILQSKNVPKIAPKTALLVACTHILFFSVMILLY